MPVSAPICIYVTDDNVSVLKSLCALLSSHGYETIACDSAEDFLVKYDKSRSACLLLDLRMPGMSGSELQVHLNEIGARLPTIVVTGHGDVPAAVKAIKGGAIDFIEKPVPEDQLLAAIEAARDVLAHRPAPTFPANVVAERLAKLTDREREVLDHLVQGKINKEIAGEFGISQRTVEVHRARIREKMDARGIADLIRMLR